MADKFSALEDRVNRVLRLVTRLKKDNGQLKRQNELLAGELADIKRRYQDLQVAGRDQTAAVKSRLATVLHRIEELERLDS
jgi:regulator of replication initiation timing